MGRLIDYAHMSIRDITENMGSEEFDPYILEAEEVDIKQILGNALFTDLVNNPEATTPPYATLLAGGSYTDGDYTYEFKGLRHALQYYAWSRYIENPYIHTVSGLTNHDDAFGTKPTQDELKKLSDNVRSLAFAFMTDVTEYLTRKSADFPLWNCGSSRNRSGQVKIRIIG